MTEAASESGSQRLFVFGEPICEHTISAGRGLLIKNTDHRRCKDDSISKLKEEVNELLNYEASEFLSILHEEKARYARDQFGLLRSLCDRYGSEKVLQAIGFCMSNSLYGATYVKDFLAQMELPVQEIKSNPIPVSDKKYHIIFMLADILFIDMLPLGFPVAQIQPCLCLKGDQVCMQQHAMSESTVLPSAAWNNSLRSVK